MIHCCYYGTMRLPRRLFAVANYAPRNDDLGNNASVLVHVPENERCAGYEKIIKIRNEPISDYDKGCITTAMIGPIFLSSGPAPESRKRL